MNSHNDLRRHGLFDARVPRYTSYPTAPQFGTAVGAGGFSDWLGDVPEGAEISLYLHVPFCRRLCWFCACRTQGTASLAPVSAYVETLLAEIAVIAAALPAGVRLARLHWGGGTPTLLPPAEITLLAAALRAAFPLAPGAEFSVEIDPGEIDDGRLDALAAAGLTRASIGVQDFDPLIQSAIGRHQPYALTRDAVMAIRARGVTSLNADILYGLPYQTEARIAASVRQLLSLSPDRVALYGYAHVPWMSRRQQMIPVDAIPVPEARLALFETATALFAEAGYEAIGIDHFARPGDSLAVAARGGHLRRNFQGYTDDRADVLVGLGASAISRLPQGYAQNAPATAHYTRAIREGRLATARGHAFAGEDRLRARIIEALMCDFRLDRDALAQAFPSAASGLDAMIDDGARPFAGLLHRDAAGLSIPPAARPLTRMIARSFDAYEAAAGQHSVAV